MYSPVSGGTTIECCPRSKATRQRTLARYSLIGSSDTRKKTRGSNFQVCPFSTDLSDVVAMCSMMYEHSHGCGGTRRKCAFASSMVGYTFGLRKLLPTLPS